MVTIVGIRFDHHRYDERGDVLYLNVGEPRAAATIITSNKAVSEWAQTFGDEALAAAILDRLLHHAEILAINGPSYRLKGPLEHLRAGPDHSD